MENKKHSSCLICDTNNLIKLKSYSNNFLVKCKNCGLVFCEPIPTIDELNKYYKIYAYENNFYSPITKQRYIELLKTFEPYRKNNKILDVGCGNGFFLETAKEEGWEVYGTEFSEKAIEVLKEKAIKSFKGELKQENFKVQMFDVITSFEVIEHINNPKEEIPKFYNLLRTGGLLYITTPNFNSISRNLLKEKWNIIGYPEHLTYYTPKTLKRLLVKNNFKKIKIKTSGFSISRFKQSKNNNISKTNKSVITSDEKLREKLTKKGFMFYFVNIINYFLNLFKKGDTIKALFIKK